MFRGGGLFPAKRVYRLSEVHEDDPEFFGEKAATLGNLVKLKLPVPEGFVVVSEGRDINVDRLSLSDNLKKQIKQQIFALEKATGRHFFTGEESEPGGALGGEGGVEAAKFPLLLSCRQSPKGDNTPLLPTTLNLGFNDEVANRALKLSNRPIFVMDCYRRFIQDYGMHVLGIKKEIYCAIVDRLCNEWGIENSSQASVQQLRQLVAEYQSITPIPQDPFRQLCAAIEAILRHHSSLESSIYRSLHGDKRDLGVSVIIQSQIYSNLTMLSSGYGSAYSRNATTGESIADAGLSGVYHSRAEGGDEVMPGTRPLALLKELKNLQPFIYQELQRTVEIVEKGYRDMVRVDFLVENGQLYVIHATRALSKTPQAAMRTLVDLTSESASQGVLLSRREAVQRVDTACLPSGEHEEWIIDDNAQKLLRWAKKLRQGSSLGVLCAVRTMHDMQKGAQLHADSFGVLHLGDILSVYYPDDLVEAGSPAKTPGERALALHGLRIKLCQELISFINTAAYTIAGGGTMRMDVDEPPASISVGGELLQRQQHRNLVPTDGPPQQRTTAVKQGKQSCCNDAISPCDCLPSLTMVLGEECIEGHEPIPTFFHPDFIRAQAHAATEALLKAQPTICGCCEMCVCASMRDSEEEAKLHDYLESVACGPCTVELNLAVPYCVSPEDLHQSMKHVEAGVIEALEEWDLATIGSVIDDVPESEGTSAPQVVRAKDRVHCHLGVILSTPQACYNTRAIASKPNVDFLILDLDSITSLTLGHKLDPEDGQTSSPGYKVRREGIMQTLLYKSYLPGDPYSSLERSCVLPMIRKAAESGRKASSVLGKQLQVLVTGVPSHDAESIEVLAKFVDAVIVEPSSLPTPLFTAASMNRSGVVRYGSNIGTSGASQAVGEGNGVMKPVIKAFGGMLQSARSGMKDLFQEEEEPFYMIG